MKKNNMDIFVLYMAKEPLAKKSSFLIVLPERFRSPKNEIDFIDRALAPVTYVKISQTGDYRLSTVRRGLFRMAANQSEKII
jgi:hypothetical protein